MDWLGYLKQQAAALGVPWEYAHAIVQGESGGNPAAHNPLNTNGTQDYGLFQLNTGGQGAGMSLAQLLNPVTNINTGLPPVARAYQRGRAAGLSGQDLFTYTANKSGHASLDITHPGRTAELFTRYVQEGGTASPARPDPWQALSTALSSPPMTLVTPEGARDVTETAGTAASTAVDKVKEAASAPLAAAVDFLAHGVAPFVLALVLICAGVFMIATDSKSLPAIEVHA